jgi:hypothetical protein
VFTFIYLYKIKIKFKKNILNNAYSIAFHLI